MHWNNGFPAVSGRTNNDFLAAIVQIVYSNRFEIFAVFPASKCYRRTHTQPYDTMGSSSTLILTTLQTAINTTIIFAAIVDARHWWTSNSTILSAGQNQREIINNSSYITIINNISYHTVTSMLHTSTCARTHTMISGAEWWEQWCVLSSYTHTHTRTHEWAKSRTFALHPKSQLHAEIMILSDDANPSATVTDVHRAEYQLE